MMATYEGAEIEPKPTSGTSMGKIALRILGGILAFILGVGIVFGGVALLGLVNAVTNEPTPRMVADLGLALVVSGLVLLYAQTLGGVPIRAFSFTWDRRGIWLAVVAGIVTLGLAWGYVFILGQSGAHPLTVVMPPLGVLLIGVIGELGVIHEEVLARGYFLALLQQRYGIGWAIFVSAVLFSLTHVFFKKVDFLLVSHFLVGIGLAYMYIKSGSLWTPIVVHAFHNLATDLFVTGNDNGVSVGIAIFHFVTKLSVLERLGFDLLLALLMVGVTYLVYGRGTGLLEPAATLRHRWVAFSDQ